MPPSTSATASGTCRRRAASARATQAASRPSRTSRITMTRRLLPPRSGSATGQAVIRTPRPIEADPGWTGGHGRANLAPYSFFNAVAYRPPQVMFSAAGPHERGGPKDSVANIAATGEFVVNLATWGLREAVNASSIAAPHGDDEFGRAGLTKAPSAVVRPPRVAESPAQL